MKRTVGVLALQGGFAAHEAALARLGIGSRQVRTPLDLAGLDGLILPGGESSTQLRLIGRHGLEGPLSTFVHGGKPVLATCAGLILAAKLVNPDQPCFGWLDVAVDRNAWGRQLDSFEASDDSGTRPLVFIRAPRITSCGRVVEVIARFRGEPVLVRRGPIVGATYHPELADDSLHREMFS